MAKAFVQDPFGLGQQVTLGKLAHRAWNRMRRSSTPRCPYRVGDAVAGDDPFKGSREGVVVFVQGSSAGIDTAEGVFFYDHRQLRKLD